MKSQIEESFYSLIEQYVTVHYPTVAIAQPIYNKTDEMRDEEQQSCLVSSLELEFEQFKQRNFCQVDCYDEFVCHTLFNSYRDIV